LVGRHPMLSGATISGEGDVLFILNVPGILQAGMGLGLRSAARSGTGGAPTLARRVAVKPRVLVVDDSLSVRKVQERILTDLGCDVVTANDGLQALERLREMSFQLIITDLEMPGMDGYQLITETRNLPRHTKTPIVVVSSRSTARYTERAIALGANTCLSKPFSEEHIDAVIDQYVRLQTTEAVAA
jgi:chemosensory pili system protein ChpA (sensor histidine kinase/response regulator)